MDPGQTHAVGLGDGGPGEEEPTADRMENTGLTAEEVGVLQKFEKGVTMTHEEEVDECFHGLLKQAAWDNAGLPMVCRWQNKQKSFGGLNSPGRWAPEDRGRNLDNEKNPLWISWH